MTRQIFSILILLIAAATWGCGGTQQIEMSNRRLVESLKTAVMAKNPAWIDKNASAIEARHKDAKITDEEYEAFQAVIQQAKAGDWAVAAEQIQQLSKGQDWSR